MIRISLLVATLCTLALACGNATGETSDDGLYPDVIGVVVTLEADGTARIDATLSSPYDSPARYADAWRVLTPDGTVLGVRELAHDHASEQPFTRSLSGIELPPDLEQLTIEGRDSVNGWGGDRFTVPAP